MAMMSCARGCPYKWLKTILGIKLKACRCDCSFVLAIPLQTLSKLQTVGSSDHDDVLGSSSAVE
jgi:hypothetical protein